MRRRRAKRAGAETEIPLTPLIDIVFLLLIYFLLASHFVEQRDVRVSLPESTQAGRVLREELVTVTVTRGGGFLVNGREVPAERLPEAVRQAAERTGARRVHLEADREARVQMLVRAMDAVKEAGLEEVVVKTVRGGP